jgi:NadR type nicotinamide-nucleotide adenylyltransferase
MKTALCLGKYAPFHLGHKYVIDTALAETDRVITLLYEDTVTKIPAHTRAGWIRELYTGQSVQVYECYDAPEEVGYTPEIMRAQERYLLKKLAEIGETVTDFYCSEAYGDHISKALGAVDHRVDCDRREFPVSATAIRENPYQYRGFIPPNVYKDLITTVVFLGGESTGKSTLAKALAEKYETLYMPEYGAEYWYAHQQDMKLTSSQLVEIAWGHIERENEKVTRANKYLFVDTNALTTYLYSLDYHGYAPPELSACADNCKTRYDLVFLCNDDMPFENTWDRRGVETRRKSQKRFTHELRARDIPFTLLEGSLEQRIAAVGLILDDYQKWG